MWNNVKNLHFYRVNQLSFWRNTFSCYCMKYRKTNRALGTNFLARMLRTNRFLMFNRLALLFSYVGPEFQNSTNSTLSAHMEVHWWRKQLFPLKKNPTWKIWLTMWTWSLQCWKTLVLFTKEFWLNREQCQNPYWRSESLRVSATLQL